jgi:hypothetical protein
MSTKNQRGATVEETESKNLVYEEWQCWQNLPVNQGGKRVIAFDKIKLLRPKVKITEKEAELNNLVKLDPANKSLKLYLLPNEDVKPIIVESKN